MPNIKSAKKRVKVSAKKSLRNRMIKNGLRTSVKKFEANVSADQLSQTVSAIDMAAAKGVIHKNAANRKKARLAKALAKASV
ncbi:MAG: 30S ribosomal protein S20 [Clostridia bacterium]|nr:30S ribosomal protein S20 [Clostridia bacterium]